MEKVDNKEGKNGPRMGRGLDSLFNGNQAEGMVQGPCGEVPVGVIDNNPNQPRRHFDPDELASLRDSIQEHGVLQPVVVRARGDRFQLIAGERRLRAAIDAGMENIPVRVVDFDDQKTMEAALVENIQRSDLNPIEKAKGFLKPGMSGRKHLVEIALDPRQKARKRIGISYVLPFRCYRGFSASFLGRALPKLRSAHRTS